MFKSKVYLFLVTSMITLLISQSVLANIISGVITDTGGNHIPLVNVLAIEISTGSTYYGSTSGISGNYSVVVPSNGFYFILPTKKFYTFNARDVFVFGDTPRVNFIELQ